MEHLLISFFHNVMLYPNEVSVTDWRNISCLVPVICEKCSKRYPRNKFSRNFPSHTREGPLGKSLLLSQSLFPSPLFLPSLALSISLAFAIWVVEVSKERERERDIEKDTRRRHPWKDDRVGPLAIISLATTRQMSDYCETRQLVGRFSPRFAARTVTEIVMLRCSGKSVITIPRDYMSVRNWLESFDVRSRCDFITIYMLSKWC